jgi:hypothetical protein
MPSDSPLNASFKTPLAAVLLCAAQLFLLLPCTIVFGNENEFSLGRSDVLYRSLTLVAGAGLLGVLFSVIAGPRLRCRVTAFFLALGICIYVQSALLVWDYGQFDGSGIDWTKFSSRGLIDSAVWAGIFGLVFLLRRSIVAKAAGISVFLLILQTVGTLRLAAASRMPWTLPDRRLELQKLFSFSAEKNVVLILLDAFQSPALAELLTTYPQMKEDFRDFIYFRNTTSSFPSTLPSVPTMLTGVPYDEKSSLRSYFEETVAQRSLPKYLSDSGFQVSLATVPGFCRFFSSSQCAEARAYPRLDGPSGSEREFLELLDYSFFRAAPQSLKIALYDDEQWFFQRLAFEMKKKKGGEDGSLMLVDRLQAESSVSAAQPTFKLIHLLLPHPPMRVGANCEILPKFRKFRKESYLDQSHCATLAARKIIAELRELKIYDQSMIIISADHGVRLDLGRVTSKSDDKNSRARISRGLPLLMVKPPGRSSLFEISDAPAQLLDIPRTVTSALGLEAPFPGENALNLRPEEPRDRFYSDFAFRWNDWDRADDPALRRVTPHYRIHGDAWNAESWQADERVAP